MAVPQFPSQTDASRNMQASLQTAAKAATNPAQLHCVTTGTVVARKETTASKLRKLFAPPDIKTIALSALEHTIIPIAKKAIADMARSMIDSFQYGVNAPRPGAVYGTTIYGQPTTYTPYNTYGPQVVGAPQPVPVTASNPSEVVCIEFQEGQAAVAVINAMAAHMAQYSMVTVANYYELTGYKFDPRNVGLSRYGWRSMDGIHVVQSGNMWSINLPRPIFLQ